MEGGESSNASQKEAEESRGEGSQGERRESAVSGSTEQSDDLNEGVEEVKPAVKRQRGRPRLSVTEKTVSDVSITSQIPNYQLIG
jgi:hypothetical protein